ncbi:MAG: hypothetical protein KBS93_03395 [Flavobacteriaceae bacterium]|nr:hypothetical protein [Candidatus Onthonaster equi]
MQIQDTIHQTLQYLEDILHQLNDNEYTTSLDILNGATIGEHVRHIVEFFQCLALADDYICYDERERENKISNSTLYTIDLVNDLKYKLYVLDFNQIINLKQLVGEHILYVKTTIGREIIYCIDHSIHHFAIIKIALITAFPQIKISNDFGIAYSTSKYKESK